LQRILIPRLSGRPWGCGRALLGTQQRTRRESHDLLRIWLDL